VLLRFNPTGRGMEVPAYYFFFFLRQLVRPVVRPHVPKKTSSLGGTQARMEAMSSISPRRGLLIISCASPRPSQRHLGKASFSFSFTPPSMTAPRGGAIHLSQGDIKSLGKMVADEAGDLLAATTVMTLSCSTQPPFYTLSLIPEYSTPLQAQACDFLIKKSLCPLIQV